MSARNCDVIGNTISEDGLRTESLIFIHNTFESCTIGTCLH